MNRTNSAYKSTRKAFLAARELHGGFYECEDCHILTTHPQVDHVIRTGMGGSSERLTDQANFRLLCGATDNNCHGKRDSGLRFK